jgi:hypothetical protein
LIQRCKRGRYPGRTTVQNILFKRVAHEELK